MEETLNSSDIASCDVIKRNIAKVMRTTYANGCQGPNTQQKGIRILCFKFCNFGEKDAYLV
jgi:hypothetical protein